MAFTAKHAALGIQTFRDRYARRVAEARNGDRDGSLNRAIANDLHFIAIASYVLNHDIDAFRAALVECGQNQLELWRRKEQGDEIFHHFVNIGSFPFVFYALAGGDFELATQLAEQMNGPVKNDFLNYFGFSTKYLVLGNNQRALEIAEEYPFNHKLEDYRAYNRAFTFLAQDNRNDEEYEDVMDRLDRAHRRDSRKSGGRFNGKVDELLCLWGLGLANLAIHRGTVGKIKFSCDVLPNDLIIQ